RTSSRSMPTRALAVRFIVSALGCTGASSGGEPHEPPDAPLDSRDDDAAIPDAAVACSETADTCAGDSICIAGRCEAAFGRLYDIRAISVSVPTLDPNGYYWDLGGGAPDLYVWIYVNGI